MKIISTSFTHKNTGEKSGDRNQRVICLKILKIIQNFKWFNCRELSKVTICYKIVRLDTYHLIFKYPYSIFRHTYLSILCIFQEQTNKMTETLPTSILKLKF